jgi:hypothetical protein
MTISNGSTIKKLALYSHATPLLQDDQAMWPDLGDDEPKIKLLSQLMVIDRNPFMIPQDDDDVLITIFSNEYGEDSSLCSDTNCLL